jgi:hypothetical protein
MRLNMLLEDKFQITKADVLYAQQKIIEHGFIDKPIQYDRDNHVFKLPFSIKLKDDREGAGYMMRMFMEDTVTPISRSFITLSHENTHEWTYKAVERDERLVLKSSNQGSIANCVSWRKAIDKMLTVFISQYLGL